MSADPPPKQYESIFDALKAHDYEAVTAMVNAGCDVNQRDANGATVLIAIICESYIEQDVNIGRLAMLLLDRGADLTAKDNAGNTALHHGTRSEYWVRFLLDAGADPRATNNEGTLAESMRNHKARLIIKHDNPSPFRMHTRRNDVAAAAQWLADHPDPEEQTEAVYGAVEAAAFYGNIEAIEFLIAHGARTLTPGLCSAASQGHESTVELLLKHGIDIINECPMKFEASALTMAAAAGRLNVVKLLIARGADVNARYGIDTSMSSLMAAAQHGHHEIVRVLLGNGADIMITRGTSGVTALSLAAEEGYIEIVRMLVEVGAYPSPINTQRVSPLIRAVERGHIVIVRYFLDHVDFPKQTSDELKRQSAAAKTGVWQLIDALLAACREGRLDCVHALLDYGADVNASHNSACALRYAAAHEHLEIVRCLLERGASVDLATFQHPRTALMMAAQKGNLPILELLLRYGADATYCLFDGETITTCAVKSRNLDVIRAIVDAGGPLHHEPREARPDYTGANAEDRGPYETGSAVAVVATMRGSENLIRLLLDRGARVNEFFNLGPLIARMACTVTYDGLLLLLAHGAGRWLATPGHKNVDALMAYCNRNLSHKTEEPPENIRRYVELLLNNGASVHTHARDGTSALYHLCKHGWMAACEVLLDFGADKNDLPTLKTAEETSDTMRQFDELLRYVPTPRTPSATRITVDGVNLFVMPWQPMLYAYAPRGFQIEARALCLLRLRAECEPTWGCLPYELFDLIVGVAWREENIRRQLSL